MVRGRHAGVVRDFQSTPTVQQKPGTTGGADSVRTASFRHMVEGNRGINGGGNISGARKWKEGKKRRKVPQKQMGEA